MITLESLLNNDNSSNINDTISLEDYSFELSNYTMECSDIMSEINTLEAASIVCEDENNKKNIFKKMIEKIRYLFKRLIEFFKGIIDKIKQRKVDRFIDTIISKIKKGEQTQFIYTSNPYVDVLYREKIDKNDIKAYVDTMNSFISNVKKSIEELESHIAKNSEIELMSAIFKNIKNDINVVFETLSRSKFAIAVKKHNEDIDEHRKGRGALDVIYKYNEDPKIWDEKANQVSKDELIDRLMWVKTVYIESVEDIREIEHNVSRLEDKSESLYNRFKDFNDTYDNLSYLSMTFKNMQEIIKTIHIASLDITFLINGIFSEVLRIDKII